MAASLDPQLSWLQTIEYSAADIMSPPRDGLYDDHSGRTTTATTTSSATNSAQFQSPDIALNGIATPERKRNFLYQRSPSALWDVCQSTPARHAHHFGPTMSSLGIANQASPSNSRMRTTDNIGSPLQPPVALYTNFDLPWTPRRLQEFADAPTIANSFYGSQQLPPLELQEPAFHPNPQRTAAHMQMPPPPPPVRSAPALRPSATKVENALAHSIASPELSWNNTQTSYENKRAWQADLPPQFRSLYNASTVGPFRVTPSVIIPAVISCVQAKIVKKFVCNKKIVRRVASWLNEKDAVMFASASTSIYASLDRTWWSATFAPSQGERPRMSAWAYLWPNSQGWCHFCLRWTRIVLHTPTAAHVCLDCIQLPLFGVITFSAAQEKFKLGSRGAAAGLAILPSVQNAENAYFWISHVEWLEAQCHAFDAAAKAAKKTTRKRKAPAQAAKVGKARQRAATNSKDATSSAGHEESHKPSSSVQAEQDSPLKKPAAGKGDSPTKVRISMRGRGKVLASPKQAKAVEVMSRRKVNGDTAVATLRPTIEAEGQDESDDDLLAICGKRGGHDGSPLQKRIQSSYAAREGLFPTSAGSIVHQAAAALRQVHSEKANAPKENMHNGAESSTQLKADVFNDAHLGSGVEQDRHVSRQGHKTTTSLLRRSDDVSFTAAASPRSAKQHPHTAIREPFYQKDGNLFTAT